MFRQKSNSRIPRLAITKKSTKVNQSPEEIDSYVPTVAFSYLTYQIIISNQIKSNHPNQIKLNIQFF
jgi:hypothetical protein